MPTNKLLPALACATLLLLAQAGPAGAITYGEPDDGQHPYVGLALFFVDDRPVTFCSGTLLAPTVFLTVAHCTYEMDFALVWFDEQIGRDAPPPAIVGAPIPHPAFDDFATFPDTGDVGVVLLDEPVWLGTYGELPELGVLDSLSTKRGRKSQMFTVVGYGLGLIHPLEPLTPPALIERRQAGTMFIDIKSALADGYNVKTSGHPGMGRGTGGSCFGDSGGPILLADSDVVVAVVSFGLDPICRAVGFSYRTDIEKSRDFIEGFLP